MAAAIILALLAAAGSGPRNAYWVYYLVWLVLLLFAAGIQSMRPFGVKKWPTAEAVVSDGKVYLDFFGHSKAEITYSYRFDGVLYTGLHRERVFTLWSKEVLGRFPKGRTFVVRVKPERPEVSVMRDDDQTDGVKQMLDRIDEEHKRDKERNRTSV
jgi:hypothetical protein